MKHYLAVRSRLLHDEADLPGLQEGLPAEWVSVRDLVAGEVAEIIRGVRVGAEDCLSTGIPVLRTRDVRDTLEEDDPCYVIPEQMKPRPALAERGDIIVSPASGKLRALVNEVGERVLATPLQALRFRTNWLDPYVAAAFLESPRNRRFAKGANWGYARVDLRDLELPLLPVEEAQQLRSVLEQLTASERQAQELAESAREVRRTLLSAVGRTEKG
jgi:hypothetical protein